MASIRTYSACLATPFRDQFRCIPSHQNLSFLSSEFRVGRRDVSQVTPISYDDVLWCQWLAFAHFQLFVLRPSWWRPPAFSWALLALENPLRRLWQTKENLGSTMPSSQCWEEICWPTLSVIVPIYGNCDVSISTSTAVFSSLRRHQDVCAQLASHLIFRDWFRCIPSDYKLAVLPAGFQVGQRDAYQVSQVTPISYDDVLCWQWQAFSHLTALCRSSFIMTSSCIIMGHRVTCFGLFY